MFYVFLPGTLNFDKCHLNDYDDGHDNVMKAAYVPNVFLHRFSRQQSGISLVYLFVSLQDNLNIVALSRLNFSLSIKFSAARQVTARQNEIPSERKPMWTKSR